MKLDNLINHPQYISLIANWFYHEWKHLNPKRTLDDVTSMIHSQLNTDTLPMLYVALNEFHELLGTSTLRIKEMETHEHLTPWLSSIYVPKDKRRHGIGQFLVTKTIQKAKELAFKKVYLFTEGHASWYKNMGWTTLEVVQHRNYPATVMEFDLS